MGGILGEYALDLFDSFCIQVKILIFSCENDWEVSLLIGEMHHRNYSEIYSMKLPRVMHWAEMQFWKVSNVKKQWIACKLFSKYDRHITCWVGVS